ncbi:MAG: diguanylate cyclase [Nitrospirae bacterium]|nr:diguanylate cyclase [Nitrospirota bacterium]
MFESIKRFIDNLVSTGLCDAIGDGISIQDTGYKIFYQNTAHKNIFGNHEGENCYKAYAHFGQICEKCPLTLVFKDGETHTSDWSVLTEKGEAFFTITASPIKREGRIVAGIQVVKDVTERRHIEEVLRENEERFRTIFNTSPIGIIVTNSEGRLLQTNPAFQNMLGYTHEELYKGFTYITHPDDVEENLKMFHEMVEGKRNYYKTEKRYYRKDGGIIWANLSATAVRDQNGRFKYNLVLIEDITGRRKLEEKLRAAAITDELTGLFNRRGFFALAEQQIKLAHRKSSRLYLLYLDLDGLKIINDECGHKMGDQALLDTANILKRSFRESDLICRIGGDEFVVLLTDPSEPDVNDVIIKHLRENLRLYNEHGGRCYELLVSLGVACYDPERPCSIDDLLSLADELMYDDKKRHKSKAV